ncbi:MAG: alpha/beta fold hydrolase [Burkholderiales bacterium]
MAGIARRWRTGWLALAIAVGASAAGCMMLEANERELVYRPVRSYVGTPADQGLDYEDVWLAVARVEGGGSERVHGWWLPADVADAPTLLYLHGTRWSLGHTLTRIARFHRLGFNVLAIDYRGFGRSDGDLPSEAQIGVDARAAWAEVVRRERRSDHRYIYGHSLGAAVAIELGATQDGAAGVIAEAGFTSLADVVADRHFPVGVLMTQRFDALALVPRLRVPVLFVHGTADAVVPAAMAQRLYAAAPEPKRLLLIEGGGHGNAGASGGDVFRRALSEFVELAQSTAHARAAQASLALH